MSLILPPAFQNEQRRAMLHERHEALRWFDQALKDFDPLLDLVKASENSDDPDLVPGYWHVRRRNAIGFDTYLAITGPDGEFAEPNSGIIEQLRRDDLQRPGAWDELMDRLDREEAAYRRKVLDERSQIREELAERVAFHDNVSVRIK